MKKLVKSACRAAAALGYRVALVADAHTTFDSPVLPAERIIAHAEENGCFFEINSSPDRLDLSAENARLAHAAGSKIAISTDAHSMREFDNRILAPFDQSHAPAVAPSSC